MPAPLEWTDEIVARLCAEVSGGRAIIEVAAESWCPSEASIYRHMAADDEFRARIDAARAAQQEHEADACVRMADEATTDDWQVVKLRIWARQWRASKLAPKRYGERVTHAGDADAPLTVQVVRMGDEQK